MLDWLADSAQPSNTIPEKIVPPMMILEHEAKALLRSVGVAVPKGTLIKSCTRAPRVREYPVVIVASYMWRHRRADCGADGVWAQPDSLAA